MKKIQKFILVLAFTFIISCSNAFAKEFQIYATDEFTIEVPNDWKKEIDKQNNCVEFYGNEIGVIDDGYLAIFEFNKEEFGINSGINYNALAKIYEEIAKSFSYEDYSNDKFYMKHIIIDEKPAIRFGQNTKMFDENTEMFMEYFAVLNEQKVLLVIYTDKTQNEEHIKDIMSTIIGHTYCGQYNEDDLRFRTPLKTEAQDFLKTNAQETVYSHTNTYEDDYVFYDCFVTKVDHYIYSECVYFDFLTIANDGLYEDRTDVSYIDFPMIKDIKEGDTIRLYLVNKGDKEFELVFIDKTDSFMKKLDEYIGEYKQKCNSYTYKELARNPERMKGEYAAISGKVFQVIENDEDINLRIAITEHTYGYAATDVVYVKYKKFDKAEDRILEDDIITVWGQLNGTYTYKAVNGSQITIPLLEAIAWELVSE